MLVRRGYLLGLDNLRDIHTQTLRHSRPVSGIGLVELVDLQPLDAFWSPAEAAHDITN